jgi:hypothetical protein
MKLKTKLLFVCMILVSACVQGQVIGIKTNTVMDGLKMINLGTEIGIGKKTTLDLTANYNPWKESKYRMYKNLFIQPEYRLWFCDRFNGSFIGIHAHGGVYQFSKIHFPFHLWSKMTDFWPEVHNYRFKGYFYGAGISYGYQWILGKHWNLEANLGAGYTRFHYKEYPCVECGDKIGEGNKDYWGITKAGISLIYFIR